MPEYDYIVVGDLPPSEWSKIDDILDDEGDYECPSRKHRPEEITGKLREAELVLAHGVTTAEACRQIGVTGQTYYLDARNMGPEDRLDAANEGS